MIKYKLHNKWGTTEVDSIFKTNDDGTVWSIPINSDNTDYQAYLKWLEDPNNKPIPADE